MPANPPRSAARRPFPDRLFGPAVLRGHARSAILVFGALYLLRPLGLDFGVNALWVCLGYGLVTFGVAVAYSVVTEFVLGWHRAGPRWTLWRWMLDCALILFFISIGNFVYYNALTDWSSFDAVILVAVAVPTVLVGLVPIAVSGVVVQLQAERLNRNLAHTVNRLTQLNAMTGAAPEQPLVQITDEFALAASDILFCEARQNYVRLVSLNAGVAVEKTVRTTLTEVERSLAGSAVIRCHRSYLVATDKLRAASGNAQGLRLELAGTDEEVPVSRRYVDTVRDRLGN